MAKKPTKKKAAAKLSKMDETGRRAKNERRKIEAPMTGERRKTARRRQIDPTTCERDYTDAEIEFMHALDEYKRHSGRMFPTCSEILEVIGKLGYCKMDLPAQQCCQHECEEPASDAIDAPVESEVEIAG